MHFNLAEIGWARLSKKREAKLRVKNQILLEIDLLFHSTCSTRLQWTTVFPSVTKCRVRRGSSCAFTWRASTSQLLSSFWAHCGQKSTQSLENQNIRLRECVFGSSSSSVSLSLNSRSWIQSTGSSKSTGLAWISSTVLFHLRKLILLILIIESFLQWKQRRLPQPGLPLFPRVWAHGKDQRGFKRIHRC